MRTFLQDTHGLSVTADFTVSDCPQTLANTNGKEIISTNAQSVCARFGVTYREVAAAMTRDEIPVDATTLLQQLVAMGA